MEWLHFGGKEMTDRVREASPRTRSRITGVVYLLYFLTAVSGELFIRGIVVSGDAAATATNILAHQSLFRLGIATGLIANAFYIALTALLYVLFKPVNRSISLIAAFFSLVGCATQVLGTLLHLAPFAVLGGEQYLSVFKMEQLQALSLMFLSLGVQVNNISLPFFGVYCLLIGYLVFRSAFLPQILGVPMALAGLGWLTFLWPPLASYLSPYILVLGFLAELLLCLWLLVMGVNVERWKELAGVAESQTISKS
jgi:hypothetical protein